MRYFILTLLLLLPASAQAQFVIGGGRPGPRPVVAPFNPFMGSPGINFQRPGLLPGYYFPGLNQFGGIINPIGWPFFREPEPQVINNFIPVPAPAPAPVPVPAPKPVELKARLKLTVPDGAKVWMNGEPVSAAASPIILESKVLEAQQQYQFDVKITWDDNGKQVETGRKVTVEAGETKSLAYYR